jgi:hypothetical protein
MDLPPQMAAIGSVVAFAGRRSKDLLKSNRGPTLTLTILDHPPGVGSRLIASPNNRSPVENTVSERAMSSLAGALTDGLRSRPVLRLEHSLTVNRARGAPCPDQLDDAGRQIGGSR